MPFFFFFTKLHVDTPNSLQVILDYHVNGFICSMWNELKCVGPNLRTLRDFILKWILNYLVKLIGFYSEK